MLHRRRRSSMMLTAALVAMATLGASNPRATVVIHGTVTDSAARPLRGASVYIGSLQVGAQADSLGRYTLRAPLARGSLVSVGARYIGYKPQSRTVTVSSDSMRVDFVMHADPFRLDEIVVTATAAATSQQSLGASVAGAKVPMVPPSGSAGSIHLRGVTGSGTHHQQSNTEEYARLRDNAFIAAAATPLSTFSIDVDRASYSNVRRFVLSERRLPPKDAVRTEELINYFPYGYAEPERGAAVAVTADVGAAPWNPQHRLVRIGLQAPRIPLAHLPPGNLVFLIDVSGSMSPGNKLPLVQRSMRMLVHELRPQDRVANVVYAGSAGLVLPSTAASDKETILGAIERLSAGGSTAGGAGIQLAYAVARQHFIDEGNNRVILATDGDFNVGVSSTAELTRMVETQREGGTFLTVLGFGMGNLKDARLEQLAASGNGNYAYIDDLLEARKVLVEEMGGTLLTVAKDVKLQVEFNPATVRAYRLIGYENRLLADRDFDDDRKDAGDIGAGHSVTALYEVVPVGVRSDISLGDGTTLRYQTPRRQRASRHDELLQVSVRYKPAGSDRSTLLRHVVRDADDEPGSDFRFASAVAAYGLLLRSADHIGDLGFEQVADLARAGVGRDAGGHRTAFVRLVEATGEIARAAAAQ